VAKGDYSNIETIARDGPDLMTSVFDVTQSRLNLYFLNSLFRERQDRIVIAESDGRARREEFQVERRRMFRWTFLDNGEVQMLRVNGGLGALDEDGRPSQEPFVVVRYSIDDRNTHSDELNHYYGLLASLKARDSILPEGFDASDWEVSGKNSGRWTRVLVNARVALYSEALERLVAMDQDAFWVRLAQRLEIGMPQLERLRRDIRSPSPANRNRARLSPLGRRAHAPVHRSVRVLRELRRARTAETAEARLHSLVRAVDTANFRLSSTYDATVLATLLEQIDAAELAERGQIAIRSRIGKAFDDENNFPERREIVGALGKEREYRSIDFPLFPSESGELYNSLDWAAEEP
jgi:hypothetical protein